MSGGTGGHRRQGMFLWPFFFLFALDFAAVTLEAGSMIESEQLRVQHQTLV